MSYEKRRRSRLRKKTLRIGLIFFIVFYLIFRSVPIIIAKNAKTILPEQGVVIDKVEFEGVIIKSENVYRMDDESLDVSIPEGERVPAGIEVGSSYNKDNISHLKKELVEVEAAISALSISEKDAGILDGERAKIQYMQSDLIEDMQESINSGEFQKIEDIKTDLLLYSEKLKDVSFGSTLLGQGLDNLKEKRDLLTSEINNNNKLYYTKESGILSYNIDGYENVFLPKEFENYTFDKLTKIYNENIKLEDDKDSNGLLGFKLIDGFEWYLAIKIDNNDHIEGYKENQSVAVEFIEEDKIIDGRVVTINATDDKSVLVLKFNTYLHEFYNLRFTTINIIKSQVEGLIIPTKIIVEKDGQKGVYIKEINGIVKFRPILVIGEEEDYTFVHKGDNNRYINIESQEELVRTISLYDEMFLNPNKIKEGQILN